VRKKKPKNQLNRENIKKIIKKPNQTKPNRKSKKNQTKLKPSPLESPKNTKKQYSFLFLI
jgi:hypothetical protein